MKSTSKDQFEIASIDPAYRSSRNKAKSSFQRQNSNDFLTSSQQRLVKTLFGDVATGKYKQEIRKLKSQCSELKITNFENSKLIVDLLSSNLESINILLSKPEHNEDFDLIDKKIFLVDQKSYFEEEHQQLKLSRIHESEDSAF